MTTKGEDDQKALRVTPDDDGSCGWCSARSRFSVEAKWAGRAARCCYRHAATALRWVGAIPQHSNERCPLCHRPEEHHPHEGCPGRCPYTEPRTR